MRGVILDWAGTSVDHGCMGPLEPFREAFRKQKVSVSISDTRRFMGLQKMDHIREMLALPDIRERWTRQHGKEPDEETVKMLYKITEKAMVSNVANYADPIEGMPGFLTALHGRGIKVGSTTGYTAPMMKVLVPAAKARGFAPDCVVCPDDVPAGRPYPWMAYLNAMRLEVYPFEAMIKIGDSVADIQEGLNAGMWTVGVTRTGNEMALTADEVKALDPDEKAHRLKEISAKFMAAGAHYVVESAPDALELVDTINSRLARGESPLP